MHMTQTAGLALAADRATDETRPRVVALLYVMFLIGMAISSHHRRLAAARFRTDHAGARGAGLRRVATLLLNLVALWKQEKVRPMSAEEIAAPRPKFSEAWADLRIDSRCDAPAGRWWRSARLASTCRTCCWSPMAVKSWACRSRSTTLLTASSALGALGGLLAGGALARARAWTRSAWPRAAR